MKTYAEKLRDPRWQRKRLEIMQRDSFQCRDCTCGTRNLQVHHCHYGKCEPWDIEDRFLLTLCEGCHRERQELENGCKVALALIMASLSQTQLSVFAHNLSGGAIALVGRMGMDEMSVDWLGEQRWIDYATEYPHTQSFVEAVLGRKIDWRNAA